MNDTMTATKPIDTQTDQEIWKPITGFEYYQISNQGQVKSLSRKIPHLGAFRITKERTLKSFTHNKRQYVKLSKDGATTLHRLDRLVRAHFGNPN